MKTRPLPPLAELREAFTYDPESGTLRRRDTGKVAGWRDADGYLRVQYKGSKYKVHRIAYALHYGEDPGCREVDHIDRNRTNNRASNLRAVTGEVNRANSSCADREVEVVGPDGEVQAFPSRRAAARALGCHPKTIRQRLRRVNSGPIHAERRGQIYQPQPVQVFTASGDLTTFPSIAAAADALRCDPEVVRGRLRRSKGGPISDKRRGSVPAWAKGLTANEDPPQTQ